MDAKQDKPTNSFKINLIRNDNEMIHYEIKGNDNGNVFSYTVKSTKNKDIPKELEKLMNGETLGAKLFQYAFKNNPLSTDAFQKKFFSKTLEKIGLNQKELGNTDTVGEYLTKKIEENGSDTFLIENRKNKELN